MEPLLDFDKLRVFLDEHGLGSGPVVARGSARAAARTSPSSWSGQAAGTCCGARPGRRSRRRRTTCSASRASSLRSSRSASAVPAIPRRLRGRDAARGAVLRHRLHRRDTSRRRSSLPAWRTRTRRRLAYDLVDTLVEIDAADGAAPALAAYDAPGSYLERQVRRFSAALGGERDARPTRRRRRRRPARRPARGAAALCRPRRLPAGEHDRRSRTRPASSRCWTGRWVRSGTRGRTWATSSPRTASRAARRARSAPRRSPPRPASRRRPTRRALRRAQRPRGRAARGSKRSRLWKAAVFCEAIYGRFIRGQLTADDTRAAAFEHVVPYLAGGGRAHHGTTLVASEAWKASSALTRTPFSTTTRAVRRCSTSSARCRDRSSRNASRSPSRSFRRQPPPVPVRRRRRRPPPGGTRGPLPAGLRCVPDAAERGHGEQARRIGHLPRGAPARGARHRRPCACRAAPKNAIRHGRSRGTGARSIRPCGASCSPPARGLGTVLTTMHLDFERDAAEFLDIPYENVTQVCLLPLAYTIGNEFKANPRDPAPFVNWNGWA